jgi:hypothetical protein
MKVTKAKGLNAKPLCSFFAPRTVGPAGDFAPPPTIEPTVRSQASLRIGSGPAHVR